jgi:hypothetical protein
MAAGRMTVAPPSWKRNALIPYNNLIEGQLFASSTNVRWVNNLADRSRESEADRVHFMNSSNFSAIYQHRISLELERVEAVRRSLNACDDACTRLAWDPSCIAFPQDWSLFS